MWPFDRHRRNEQRELVQQFGKHSTPDIAELEQSEYQILFVCDDMKRAHQNHKLIKGLSEKVGRGFTADNFDFRVGKFTGRGLPFVDKTGQDSLKIKGEVHKVVSPQFKELDKHYKNGVEFARVQVPILITDREHRLIPIGSENWIKKLGPGAIRTVPELGVRHYLSHRHSSVLRAFMYVALRNFWVNDAKGALKYDRAEVVHPKEPLIWLPKYYNYPINRNRCLK